MKISSKTFQFLSSSVLFIIVFLTMAGAASAAAETEAASSDAAATATTTREEEEEASLSLPSFFLRSSSSSSTPTGSRRKLAPPACPTEHPSGTTCSPNQKKLSCQYNPLDCCGQLVFSDGCVCETQLGSWLCWSAQYDCSAC